MRRVKLIAAAVLAVLCLVVVLQNTDVVTVRFLAWEAALSQVILLLLVLLAGFLLGYLVARKKRGQVTLSSARDDSKDGEERPKK